MSTSKASIIDKEIRKAGEVLRSGGTILYPTDTIWGIGCDATCSEAVERIFQIKQRAESKSMLILVSDLEMLRKHVSHVPEQIIRFLQSTDKPTSIIYPDGCRLATRLLAEDGSVGIRLTADPFCHPLIQNSGFPLVSTSANISGDDPPKSFADISPEIRQKVDHIVTWRQDDRNPATPSSIFKLQRDGSLSVIRP